MNNLTADPLPNEPDPVPVVLVSRGWLHPHPFVRREMLQTLRAVPGMYVTTAPTLEQLPPGELAAFRCAVLFFHEKHISPAALAALEDYLQSGGGVLAVHGAAASFKASERYFKLLGGRFLSHGAVQEIHISAQPDSRPIVGPLTAFSIRDEFYRMETRADIQVLLTARQGEVQEPFAWIRQQGAGRLLYLAAGHTTASLRHPTVKQIVQRGLIWCSGQPRPVVEA